MDTKAPCTCNHPASEHSQIEGLHGLGHCKVPGCECGAFVAVGGGDAPPEGEVPARHTLIARATNADGSKGINLSAAEGPGVAIEVPDEVAMQLGQQAKMQYEHLFSEPPTHVGVAALPFLHDQDKEPGGFNMPAEPGIHMKGDGTLEEAIEAVEEGGPIIKKVPLDALRPRDRLLAALYDIDIELAARVLMDEYETTEARAQLATHLTDLGTTASIELANRIRAGEFEGEG